MLNKKKLYWYAQLFGWLVYVFIVGLFNKLSGNEVTTELIVSLLSIYLIGLSITHFYRAIIIKFNWMRHSVGLLVPRVLLSVVVWGIVVYLIQTLVLEVIIAKGSFEFEFADAFQKIINWALLLLLWSLFYFLFHFINNYKQEEIKNLKWQAAKNEIEYLTLFAFSTDNWSRPKDEVNILMKLLVSSLRKEFIRLTENNIKLCAVGDLDTMPQLVKEELTFVIEKTKNNTGMVLTLALNYGGKEEIVEAVKAISHKVKNSIISPEKVDESTINEHLYTRNLPPVDLLIRTSGEERISNFLLWHIAYAELYFTKTLWPDFTKEDLQKALLNYGKRERRFGKTSEQLTF